MDERKPFEFESITSPCCVGIIFKLYGFLTLAILDIEQSEVNATRI
jgi:hypothetical protein